MGGGIVNIIRLTPNPSGAYPPIQTWSGSTPPVGYAEVNCDTSVFYEYRGFVTLLFEDDVVVGFTGNQTALDAYLAEFPDPVIVNTPTQEERLAALEAAMLELVLGGAT